MAVPPAKECNGGTGSFFPPLKRQELAATVLARIASLMNINDGRMQLFEEMFAGSRNLLPRDGTVHYFGRIFPVGSADHFFERLMNDTVWEHDKAVVFGKTIVTKRKVAWYGDEHFDYTYSGITRKALRWSDVLVQLKETVEKVTGENFNSCLLNLYHNGDEGMAWHSDGEKELKKNGAIASVSFGAERKFSFKHKVTKEKVDILLQHGSLLVMKDTTQTHWLHRLPPVKHVQRPRINLTFRIMTRR